MKKILTKIIGASLAIAMMIGVGTGLNYSKDAKPVDADANTYVRAESLTANDEVLIVAYKSSKYYYMPQTNGSSSAPTASEITVSNNSISGDYDDHLFKVVANSTNWQFQSLANSNNYLYTTNANNGIRIGTNTNRNYTVTEKNTTNHYFEMKNTATNRYVGVFNTQDWRSYDSATHSNYGGSGRQIQFYRKAIAPTGISLNETDITINVGANFTLTPTFTPGGASAAITWSSDDQTVATVSNGVVHGVGAGSTTITARVNESIYATCDVTVAVLNIPATDIYLDVNSGTLVKGQTKTLTATVTPNDTTDNVVWSSSDESVATVSNNGLVTAIAAGNAVITVEAGSVHDDFDLTVYPLDAIHNYVNAQVNITGKVVAVGGKNAMIDDGTSGLWTYSAANVTAEVGDVVTVTGSTVLYNGGLEVSSAVLAETQQSEVTITTAEPISADEVASEITKFNTIQNYAVSHKRVSLRTGTVATSGDYLIFPYGSSTIEILFANCGMVAGKVYDIEAYLTSFYKKNNYLCICVASAQEVSLEPTGISLNKTQVVVGSGSSTTLTATITPNDAPQNASWSSANESIATVENGVVTGHAIGVTTVTATAGGFSATCKVIVSESTKADYSLVFNNSSASTYANMYNHTFDDGQQWKIPGNQNVAAGLKIGGKPADNTDRCLYSMTEYESVASISITHGAKDSQITVNSLTLYVFDSADDAATGTPANAVDTVVADYAPNSVVTFEPTAQGTRWIGKYFRIVYNMVSSNTSSNYGLILTRLTLDIENPSDHLESALTIKTISGTESNGGATVENVSLRFGGRILISDWNEINSRWPITDYGIMFARASMLTARSKSSLEEVFRNNPEDVAIVHKQTFTAPVANGNEYIFTARLNLEESDYDTVFYATPYIVAGGEYYFLQEEHESVRTLANDCYNNGGSSLSQTALATLKGNN